MRINDVRKELRSERAVGLKVDKNRTGTYVEQEKSSKDTEKELCPDCGKSRDWTRCGYAVTFVASGFMQ